MYPTLNRLTESVRKAEPAPYRDWSTTAQWLADTTPEWLAALKRNNNRPLLRGIKNPPNHEFGFVSTPRRRRRLSDMHPVKSEIVDTVLSYIGFEGTRTDSLFCTTDKGEASGYGHVYVICPIGEFQLCSSDIIRDLTDWQEEDWQGVDEDFVDYMSARYPEADPDMFEDEYWEVWPQANVFVHEDQFSVFGLEKKSQIKKAAKLLGYHTDTERALASRNEVLMYTRQYYAVDAKNWSRHLLPELQKIGAL